MTTPVPPLKDATLMPNHTEMKITPASLLQSLTDLPSAYSQAEQLLNLIPGWIHQASAMRTFQDEGIRLAWSFPPETVAVVLWENETIVSVFLPRDKVFSKMFSSINETATFLLSCLPEAERRHEKEAWDLCYQQLAQLEAEPVSKDDVANFLKNHIESQKLAAPACTDVFEYNGGIRLVWPNMVIVIWTDGETDIFFLEDSGHNTTFPSLTAAEPEILRHLSH